VNLGSGSPVQALSKTARGFRPTSHEGIAKKIRDYLHISRLCSATTRHILRHRGSHNQIERQLESGNGERRGERGSSPAHVCAHEFHALFRCDLASQEGSEGRTYGAGFEAGTPRVERDSFTNKGEWTSVGLLGAFVVAFGRGLGTVIWESG